MSSLKVLKRWFPTFFTYEKAVLESVALNLEEKACEIFQKQISLYNSISRLNNHREINMYCIRKGKVWFDDELRFPLNLPEIKLAKVKIREKNKNDVPKGNKPLTVEIWMVKGQVFSMIFNNSPKYLKNSECEIIDVKILEDPMQQLNLSTLEKPSKSLNEWLGESLTKLTLITAFAPLPLSVRAKQLKELNCSFPADWMDFIELCNGLEFERCKIYGLYNIRQINTDKFDLLVLAERSDTSLLVINRSLNDGYIYILNVENDDAEPIVYEKSFHKALIRYLEI